MITITLNQIKADEPCHSGWKKVLKANGGTKADMDKPFPMSSILDSNDLDDTVWCIFCLPEHEKVWTDFAFFCVLQVVEIMKPKCRDVDYETIIKYLNTQDDTLTKEVVRITNEVIRCCRNSGNFSVTDAARSVRYLSSIEEGIDTIPYVRSHAEAAMSYTGKTAMKRFRTEQEAKLRELLDNN